MPKGFVALSDGTPVVHGIDVSKWQGSVDFIKIASCGGRFAYIRLSAGQNPDNELEYRALWNNARYANLHVGPYHNLTFINLNGSSPNRVGKKAGLMVRKEALDEG
jgi:GH25 family lysozyme M1 (1,4-beta-N-acetylmuramidase)